VRGGRSKGDERKKRKEERLRYEAESMEVAAEVSAWKLCFTYWHNA